MHLSAWYSAATYLARTAANNKKKASCQRTSSSQAQDERPNLGCAGGRLLSSDGGLCYV